jgi:nuclear protein NHN1
MFLQMNMLLLYCSRFVHPGVTDKGNYTMFDMVRPLVPVNGPPVYPPMDYRSHYEKSVSVSLTWPEYLYSFVYTLTRQGHNGQPVLSFH